MQIKESFMDAAAAVFNIKREGFNAYDLKNLLIQKEYA